MNEQLLLALIPYVVPVLVMLLTVLGKLLLDKLPASQRKEAAALIQAAVLAADHMSPGDKATADALIEQVLSAAHVKCPPALVETFTRAALSSLPPAVDAVTPPVGFAPPAAAPAEHVPGARSPRL